ncbi:MAG TPA: mechanosensitive ion channel family protein [Burkholderiales bacterium]|jgi:small-conductance mechanosensitive channel|nr:mechanosensitive ion channel family protein [Burkholderiales bacterium]
MNALLNALGVETLPAWVEHAMPIFHVLLILLLAWIALHVANRAIRKLREMLEARSVNPDDQKRIRTLGRVFRYIANVVIILVAGMLVLTELGISIAPILATAGVAGIAIGFGAQSLIKDYFSGIFLLVEDQIRQGDVVAIADKAGLVEEITLRYVRLRDFEGNVHFVPNGAIGTVTNRSREFAFALIDAGVAYREDVDEALEVMRRVGEALRADSAFGPRILEPIEIVGVENWADSAVILRCRLKVKPLEQWNVRREFLRRLKRAFDERGIEIPYPHLTLYAGQNKDGSAPPLRIARAAKS